MDSEIDPSLARRCAIAIMAKAPKPGRSKTRLCPPLNLEEAAAMSGAFLRDMTAAVARAGDSTPIDLFVAYAPIGAEADLMQHLPAQTPLILADGVGIDEPGVDGFGRPLLQTIRALLSRGYGAVCVLNSDSPTLPAGTLVSAADALSRGDNVVLGAAEDGGYYLLGMARDHPSLFAGIAWSTAAVADQTRAQAARLGVPVVELPHWYDVDDASSLRRLITDLNHFGNARAPASAAMLHHLGLYARLSQPA